jgi:hypothetical protein
MVLSGPLETFRDVPKGTRRGHAEGGRTERETHEADSDPCTLLSQTWPHFVGDTHYKNY